eukprot:5575519-Pyramimonas_sp.AAC.1
MPNDFHGFNASCSGQGAPAPFEKYLKHREQDSSADCGRGNIKKRMPSDFLIMGTDVCQSFHTDSFPI